MSDVEQPPTRLLPQGARRFAGRDRRALREVVLDELRHLIREGGLGPGSRLPSEPALAEMLAVSRGTLREAIRALELEGLLVHRRGVGTFLAAVPRLRNSLDVNFGVTQLIESMGLRPGTRLADVREEAAGNLAAGNLAAERLGIHPRDPVIRIERVRTADGRPVVHSLDIIPRAIARRLPEFSREQSIYAFLQESCGQVVQYGIARLMPAEADARVARLLGVKRGTLLMVVDQVDYAADSRAVLFSLEHHLADAFEMTVFRKGSGLGVIGG